eukprot:521860-Rhodomonas_salina.1
MRKSLYGLKQAGASFYSLLSTWLKEYGFKAVGSDGVTYSLRLGKSVILLTLFVDNGLCTTNDHALYCQFVQDLSEKFELGEAGLLKWYLGVAIKQDIQSRTTELTQPQYALDVLKQFSMDGCKPASTPLQPN